MGKIGFATGDLLLQAQRSEERIHIKGASRITMLMYVIQLLALDVGWTFWE